MNKRGSARDVMFAGVIIFIIALGFFALNFAFNTLFDGLINSPLNESSQGATAMQQTLDILNKMDYLVIGLFFALSIGVFITGWFIGGQPIFMIIYFLIVSVITLVCGIFANIWVTISSASVWATTLARFPMTNHLLTNLHIYIAVVGVIGMIVMFAKPYMSQESGGIG